jgi:hypothetical protein
MAWIDVSHLTIRRMLHEMKIPISVRWRIGHYYLQDQTARSGVAYILTLRRSFSSLALPRYISFVIFFNLLFPKAWRIQCYFGGGGGPKY